MCMETFKRSSGRSSVKKSISGVKTGHSCEPVLPYAVTTIHMGSEKPGCGFCFDYLIHA